MIEKRKVHKHWVSAIETRHSVDPDRGEDPYGGIRLTVHHSRDEAEADVREWVEYALGRQFASAEAAASAYRDSTGMRIVVEEQYA